MNRPIEPCDLCGKDRKGYEHHRVWYTTTIPCCLCQDCRLKWGEDKNHKLIEEKYRGAQPETEAWEKRCLELQKRFDEWFKEQKQKTRLNMGSGKEKVEGFTNVDIGDFADVQHDLNKHPYPFEDNSIEEIYAFHIVEHLKEPLEFFKECYRIMKQGARMEIRVPHVSAFGGAFGTFEHLHFFHESAIGDLTGETGSSTFPYRFKLISTEVKHGRFLFWQKREIIWVIEK